MSILLKKLISVIKRNIHNSPEVIAERIIKDVFPEYSENLGVGTTITECKTIYFDFDEDYLVAGKVLKIHWIGHSKSDFYTDLEGFEHLQDYTNEGHLRYFKCIAKYEQYAQFEVFNN